MAAERPIAERFQYVTEIEGVGRWVALIRCNDCAALVEHDQIDRHVAWHTALAVRAVAGEENTDER